MKTRQEMIYEFMIALASAYSTVESAVTVEDAEYVYKFAARLADVYLDNI